ncbi:MAG: peptidoglycan-binding domain-containing protein [Bradyrhizobium sp.]
MAMAPLKLGDTGNMVKALQLALIAHGNSVGPSGATGTFDENTLTAMEAFQDGAAIPVQATCDKTTWTALGPST